MKQFNMGRRSEKISSEGLNPDAEKEHRGPFVTTACEEWQKNENLGLI